MYGAIIGDVAGSYHEVLEISSKRDKNETKDQRYKRRIMIMNYNTLLFTKQSSYTDDTVLTLSILDASLNKGDYESYLRNYSIKEINKGLDIYGRNRFSLGFINWLYGKGNSNSYGNGCAMRVSAIGFLYDDIDTIKQKTIEATIPSHNHPDSLLCAEAITTSIYYLRNGFSKEELKKYITNNYFKLDYDIENLRYNYEFTSKAIDSVPIAIYAFLISSSFENAIRVAISCGGDSDTIAAITGSLAEAYYGIPNYLINEVNKYLTEDQIKLLSKVYNKGKVNKYYKY